MMDFWNNVGGNNGHSPANAESNVKSNIKNDGASTSTTTTSNITNINKKSDKTVINDSLALDSVLANKIPTKILTDSDQTLDKLVTPSHDGISTAMQGDTSCKTISVAAADATKPLLDPDEVDNLLARELRDMSLKEREQVLYDIHGVSDVCVETPELRQTKLDALENEIQAIGNKPAYDLAMQQSPAYVFDPTFRLQFLRADGFDPKEAAYRMTRYFERKLQLFPPNVLTKDITLADFNATDLAALKSGFMQVAPSRDRAGRPIVFLFPSLRKDKDRIHLLRVFWYMVMVLMEDEENQKTGVVVISYNVGPERVFDPSLVRNIARTGSSLPMRMVGVHSCFDNPIMRAIAALAMVVLGQHTRARFRHHYGTHQECQFELLSFGIPQSIIPISCEGNYKFDSHKEWFRKRVKIEKHEASLGRKAKRIDLPGRYDVLFGRGKPIQEHPGNLRYHHVLDVFERKYESSVKFAKTAVAEEIVHSIHQSTGRFLREDKKLGFWVEVSDGEARDKVSHAYRTRRSSSGNSNKYNNVDNVSDHSSTTPSASLPLLPPFSLPGGSAPVDSQNESFRAAKTRIDSDLSDSKVEATKRPRR